MIGGGRLSNFDTLRLIAAASVIFSHAFLIADGHEQNEPFMRLTGAIIGIHGVFVFLIISGFLVTRSLRTSVSLREFAWKRILRIYPALAVCAIVSAAVIAPFFSELGVREYLSSLYDVKYVAKVLMLRGNSVIPTVKFYDQEIRHLGYSVNGSLWTIASEIHCYFILFCMAALEVISIPILLFGLFVVSMFLALSLVVNLPVGDVGINLLYTVPSFCAGAAIELIHTKYRLSGTIALGCLCGLILVAPTGYLMVLFPILGAYPVIYLGMSESIFLGNATRFGDLSYGTYLYGWPVTQLVRSEVGTSLTGWGLFLISLPLAVTCGWLSWHLVEKHALALKKAVRHMPKSLVSSACRESSVLESSRQPHIVGERTEVGPPFV
jgi:peptidoglycan/LPS O-acetylase OafA/YrhL